MANTVSENLINYLAGDTAITKAIGARFHQNHVPMVVQNGVAKLSSPGDYIWFAKDSAEDEVGLADAVGTGPLRHFYNLEVVAREPRHAETLAETIYDRCHKANRGTTFGDMTVQGIFVEPQGADYVRRNELGDSGFHIEAMRLEVVPI